ncbi:MAG TPA: methyltransferase domain-containing protein [Acidobacteriota bacterium]|nr:methyltransferase domain-containing protein [Acidobacteriota bacterium]
MTTRGSEPASIDPFVQQWIAGTNGRLYVPVINKLKRYPIPNIPIKPVSGNLLLDIGCGWGRWMVSAAKSGFLPIGLDIKLEAVQAARRVLTDYGYESYFVVSDFMNLPFRSCAFDYVFSYSALQHSHRTKTQACIQEINRILKSSGHAMLQFPLAQGIANRLRGLPKQTKEADDPDSWVVRYYTLPELENTFESIFGAFDYQPDCYLGIGVQGSDLDVLPWKYKPVVIGSELLKFISKLIPPVGRIADSVFVSTQKSAKCEPERIQIKNQSDFLSLLRCPLTGSELSFDSSRKELVSQDAGIAFPVVDGIPVLIPNQGRTL